MARVHRLPFLALTLLLILAATSALALTPPPDYITLTFAEGESSVSAEVDVSEGESAYFAFTPEETGVYTFYSYDNVGDPYGYLYDSDMNLLTENDDYDSSNFRMEWLFMEEELYYLRASCYDDWAGAYSISLEKVDSEGFRVFMPQNPYYTIAPNEEFVLTVNAISSDPDAEIAYQWYTNYGELIEGETSNQYKSTATSGYMSFRCEVTCGEETQSANFYVSVDNFIRDDDIRTDYFVPVGESITLDPGISAKVGNLTYQWLIDDEPISEEDGGTGRTYTFIPERSVNVRCTVTDEYDNQSYTEFDIQIDNDFFAYAKENEINVPYGEPATLEVVAQAATGDLTYRWTRWNPEGHEDLLENEVQAKLTIESITERSTYNCTVEDQYGSREEITFTVGVDNAFRILDIQANGRSVSFSDQPIEIPCEPEQPVTLAIYATATDTEGLQYRWQWDEENLGSDSALNIPSLTNGVWYECWVTDKYGNSEYFEFHLYPDNQLTATAANGEVSMKVVAEDGGDAVLEVLADCAVGETYYRWYDENYNIIEGEDGNKLVVSGVTSAQIYYCQVYDDYSDPDEWEGVEVFFRVITDNLTVSSPVDEETQYIRVSPGSEVTLSVQAQVKTGNIEYRWYVDQPQGHVAEGSSYHISTITEPRLYFCKIMDEFGSEELRTFWVSVDNGLYAEADTETRQFASPGQRVTLRVYTSVIKGPLSFTWKEDYYTSDEHSDALDVIAPEMPGEYYYTCTIKDAYGNKRKVHFSIVVGEMQALQLNTPINKRLEEEQPVYFSFTPETTGTYTFKAHNTSYSPYVVLYDTNWDRIDQQYDELGYRMKAGTQYYFSVVSYDIYRPTIFTMEMTRAEQVPVDSYLLRVGQSVQIPFIGQNKDIPVQGYEADDASVFDVEEEGFTALSVAEEAKIVAYGEDKEGTSTITIVDPEDGVFTLPDQLTSIRAGAFTGVTGIQYLEIGEKLEVLSEGTFAGATLKQLVVRGANTKIEEGAFSGTPTVICREGSLAASYAKRNNLPYLYLAD